MAAHHTATTTTSQLVVKEDAEKLKQMSHLPEVLQQTQQNLKMAKQTNQVLQAAIGIEKGVQEAMDG